MRKDPTLAFVLFIILAALLMVACTQSWKGDTVTAYEITGATLTEIHNTAKPLCDNGTIAAEDCEKIKDLYNKTRLYYIVAGNALKVAINTEDSFVRKVSMEEYQQNINQAAALLPDLIQLAGDLGILKGGSDGH